MVIAQDVVVSLYYTLTDDEGTVIDSNRDDTPLDYIHGHGMMIPGFEKALQGAKKDQEISFSVAPSDGYGEHNAEDIFDVPRSEFNPTDDLQVGGYVDGTTEEGYHKRFVIVGVTDEHITLDGNHPLAGKKLNFDVEILNVREATPQEIEHKHVHAGGHDH